MDRSLLQNLIHIPINKQGFPFAYRNLHAAVLNVDASSAEAVVAVEGAVEHVGGYAGVASAAMEAAVDLKGHIVRDAEGFIDRVGGPGGQGFTGAG